MHNHVAFESHQQPVLDIKPYLPYCDSIQEAAVPNWLMVMLPCLLAISVAAYIGLVFLINLQQILSI